MRKGTLNVAAFVLCSLACLLSIHRGDLLWVCFTSLLAAANAAFAFNEMKEPEGTAK